MKKLITAAVVMALIGVQLGSANVFASPYDMDYTGGSPLDDTNINIDPEYVQLLLPLIGTKKVSTTVPEDYFTPGYFFEEANKCTPILYYTVPVGPRVQLVPSDKPYFIISNETYRIEVVINNTVIEQLENFSDDDSDKNIAFGVKPNSNFVFAGWQIYSDETCETPVDNLFQLRTNGGVRAYIEMNANLYKANSEEVFTSDELYFGITDIDFAQSFKITNDNNEFSRENTYAKSVEDLQSNSETNDLKNMFNPYYNYIYSEYDEKTGAVMKNASRANVYTRLNTETQSEGVNFIFGFATTAGSGIEYYSELYIVQYEADENGIITGLSDEMIVPGDLATGSAYQANKNYVFSHWIADVDVMLEDGTIIGSGEKITNDQVKLVVVDTDIKFTAIFKEDVKVPNTGASTKEYNATQIATSIFGILLGVLFIVSLPYFIRRKVNFEK